MGNFYEKLGGEGGGGGGGGGAGSGGRGFGFIMGDMGIF